MATQAVDLWSLTFGKPQVDPNDLVIGIVNQVLADDLDYRSRLLIRDSISVLKSYWGELRVSKWLSDCPVRERIESICREEFDKVGFPSLPRRLREKTEPSTIREYLRRLGEALTEMVQINIAGVSCLILQRQLVQGTDNIAIVDEIPPFIRKQHAVLAELKSSHGLHLGYLRRHYFPARWEHRTEAFGLFGRLSVRLVDRYDVMLSKLFSSRIKDFTDLRMVTPRIDKDVLAERFKSHCQDFLVAERLKEIATMNWHILFKEDLPS